MADRRSTVFFGPAQSQNVEADRVIEQAVFLQKMQGKARQAALFYEVHGKGRAAEIFGCCGANFDKHHTGTVKRDQVHFPQGARVVPPQDPQPVSAKVASSCSFGAGAKPAAVPRYSIFGSIHRIIPSVETAWTN